VPLPGAGHDHDPDVIVGTYDLPDLFEGVRHAGVNRVAAVWAVKRDDRHMVTLLI
jgi:hypothetical protein